ncbi:MAG: DUF1559 domain-containing protein [Capsulimonadaceae bacterium]|nr:DUF1559 domain-containing protein [Capsulimonadaceae bacterium]
MNRKQAFTLIELLVVIAIIAILAAILFPVFATAREKARQSTCLSNEKEIGLGVMQYLSDNDECFPRGTFGNWTIGFYDWTDAINPYVKSTGGHNTSAATGTSVYKCPSNPLNQWNYSDSYFDYRDTPMSYAGNSMIMTGYATPFSCYVSIIPAPASTVLIMESRTLGSTWGPWDLLYSRFSASTTGYPSGQTPLPAQGLAFDHQGYVNLLYADCHAKPTKMINVYQSSTDSWMAGWWCAGATAEVSPQPDYTSYCQSPYTSAQEAGNLSYIANNMSDLLPEYR